MGDVNKKYIEVIIKNPSINKEELESYCGKNIILMFYSRNGYHYTKMDTIKKNTNPIHGNIASYFINDSKR